MLIFQVVFQVVHAASVEEQVAIDHIGVRKGSCGKYYFTFPLLSKNIDHTNAGLLK